jgi:hypothetical protein
MSTSTGAPPLLARLVMPLVGLVLFVLWVLGCSACP